MSLPGILSSKIALGNVRKKLATDFTERENVYLSGMNKTLCTCNRKKEYETGSQKRL